MIPTDLSFSWVIFSVLPGLLDRRSSSEPKSRLLSEASNYQSQPMF